MKYHNIVSTPRFKVHTLVNGSFKENCYIVEDIDEFNVSIIDPGSEFEMVRDYIDQLNLLPNQILLTHGHFDHIGAVDQLVNLYNCTCYVSALEKKLIRQAGFYAYRFSRTRLLPPSRLTYFNDSEDLKTFPESLKIISTPGHTSGGVSYFFGSELLFTGDSLFHSYVGPTNYPTSSHQDLVLSIETLLNTIPNSCLIFPGHGKSWSIMEAKSWWSKVKERPPQFHLFGGGSN